jgi:hypothetical protein
MTFQQVVNRCFTLLTLAFLVATIVALVNGSGLVYLFAFGVVTMGLVAWGGSARFQPTKAPYRAPNS